MLEKPSQSSELNTDENLWQNLEIDAFRRSLLNQTESGIFSKQKKKKKKKNLQHIFCIFLMCKLLLPEDSEL